MDTTEIVEVTLRALDEANVTDRWIRDMLTAAELEPPPWLGKNGGLSPAGGVRRVAHQVYCVAFGLRKHGAEKAFRELHALVHDTFPRPGVTEQRYELSDAAQAAWSAAATRTPAALLDLLLPAPRVPSASVLADVLGDLEPDALRARLTAADPVERLIGLRAIAKPRLEAVLPELIELAVRDESPEVQAEALAMTRRSNQKVKAKLAAAAGPLVGSEDPRTCAGAIRLLGGIGSPIAGATLATMLRHPAMAVRIAACGAVRAGAAAEVQLAVTEMLRDDDPAARVAALKAATEIGVDEVEQPELWVDALRGIVRDGPDARLAIYLLGQMGTAARPAALDIIRAMPTTDSPYQAAQAVIAGGELPAEGRPLLETYVRESHSAVAEAAIKVLEKLAGGITVTVADRVKRIASELASDDPELRETALFYAERLKQDGSALIPALRALGERLASDPARTSELDSVRKALLAVGCPADDLPHAPSHFEVVAGTPPRERRRVGELMIGELTRVVEHGRVGVPRSSSGLWHVETGKLLFLVDDAEVLAIAPGGQEAFAVRTSTRADARFGGTSRGDLAWSVERRAIPSGTVLSSLELPRPFTFGSPTDAAIQATETGNVATVFCGDEDSPYLFQVALGEGASPDRLLHEQPQPWTRRSQRKAIAPRAAAREPAASRSKPEAKRRKLVTTGKKPATTSRQPAAATKKRVTGKKPATSKKPGKKPARRRK